MKKGIVIVLCFAMVLLSSCSNEKTSDLTTQNRTFTLEKETCSSNGCVSEGAEDINGKTSLSTETDTGVTGEEYLDKLADRLGVTKESYLDDYGFYYMVLAAGDTLTEGLSKAFPNVDFDQTELSISDEMVTEQLILSEKLKKQSSVIKYKEISLDEAYTELEFQAQIHSVYRFKSKDELDVTFRESEAVQSDIAFFEENPYSDIYGFTILDVTFTNLSECPHGIYVNNLPIYTDYGSIGIYSIVFSEMEYMEFTYYGGTRGIGTSRDRLYLNPGESSRLQILYADLAKVSADDLFIDLNPLISFGYQDGKGTYHPNTDPELALYKLKANP